MLGFAFFLSVYELFTPPPSMFLSVGQRVMPLRVHLSCQPYLQGLALPPVRLLGCIGVHFLHLRAGSWTRSCVR